MLLLDPIQGYGNDSRPVTLRWTGSRFPVSAWPAVVFPY